jgi:hypothetical protein
MKPVMYSVLATLLLSASTISADPVTKDSARTQTQARCNSPAGGKASRVGCAVVAAKLLHEQRPLTAWGAVLALGLLGYAVYDLGVFRRHADDQQDHH